MSFNFMKLIYGVMFIASYILIHNIYSMYIKSINYDVCKKELDRMVSEKNKLNDKLFVYYKTINELNVSLQELEDRANILEILKGDDNETDKDIFDDIVRVKF